MRTLKWLVIMMVVAALVLPAQATMKVKIKAQKANVRGTADVSGPVLRQVSAGMVFDVIEKSGAWYKVQLPADGVNPAQKGYIHENVVAEVGAETATSPKTQAEEQPKPQPKKPVSQPKQVQKEQSTPPPQKSVRASAADVKEFKRFSLRGSYFMGFTEETLASTYTPTLYQEQASFVTSYEAKKGNAIDAALGFKFSPAFGVEIGGSMVSRDVAAAMTVSVPHPLLFDNPRQASGTAAYTLKETDLYLNLMYTFEMNSLAIDLFAGPCYVMSKTTIVSGYAVTDVYPYTDVAVTYNSLEVKKNVFGFDAGIAIGYYFGDTVGLVVSGRFVSAKGKFETATDVPGVEYKLGGLQAGAGLKIKF